MASPAEGSLREQYEAAQAQLAAYARDFRALLDKEREKGAALEAANRQLQSYAQDLRRAFDAQQTKAQELERSYLDTVHRLVRASRFKDEETGNHITRLSHYARVLALQLGWQQAAADLLFEAAPMHDLGKIAIPDAVLQKPGPLNEAEWDIMRRHPRYGAELLKGSSSPLLELARRVALGHHERWDGTGYPQRLRGERIPAACRVILLVDQYDALRSRRPYKPSLPHTEVCQIILHGDGRTLPQHFEPAVLAAFSEVHLELDRIYEQYAD